MLPKTTEYALRAMAWLATQPPGTGSTSAQLAEHTSIPRHYVSKLMRRLVVAKLVVSQRGHGGGFLLARPADEIRFIEILNAFDFPTLEGCLFGWAQCHHESPCPLHAVWVDMRTTFTLWAEGTRLSQVASGEVRQPRLGPPSADPLK